MIVMSKTRALKQLKLAVTTGDIPGKVPSHSS